MRMSEAEMRHSCHANGGIEIVNSLEADVVCCVEIKKCVRDGEPWEDAWLLTLLL